jgi:hypothetical protein
MKWLLFIAGTIATSLLILADSAHATSLKIAPLEYRTALKTGESKKGFIDISNPSNEKVIINTSVQKLIQTDNNGTLKFIGDKQLEDGVKLDLDSFELKPKEAVRMYFLIDGKALPSGDVFGAIFFTTEPSKATNGSGQSVKLGSILSIINGTPGSRSAELLSLTTSSFTFDNAINGSYTVKNTGDPNKSTGFYPQVSIRVWPFGKEKIQTGKLVFAGRSRENTFKTQTPPFGIYRIQAAYGDSNKSKWVVVLHPLAIVGIIIGLLGLMLILKLRKRRNMARKSNFSSS